MKFLICISLLFAQICHGQNLVPNPSFEEYDLRGNAFTCPSLYSLMNNPTPNTSCCWATLPEYPAKLNGATNNWWSVNTGKDPNGLENYYFNKCTFDLFEAIQQHQGVFSTHNWYKPRTGEAFIILFTYGDLLYVNSPGELRGYAQVKLTEPLKAGCMYEASCFALLTTNFEYFIQPYSPESQASDGFGMYISKDSLYGTDPLKGDSAFSNLSPQVSNPSGQLMSNSINYQKVSGVFTATGGEEWLVIGNFKDNAHTKTANRIGGTGSQMNSIYAIDDVSITEWKPDLVPFTDINLCANQTLTITLPKGLKDYKWSTGETTSEINVVAGGRYTIEASNGCTLLRDTFEVHDLWNKTFSIGTDTLLCEGSELKIEVPMQSTESIQWNDGSTNASYNITHPGIYWATLSNGCFITSDSIDVTFIDCRVNIPNLITVNGDNLNDYFVLQTKMNRTFELTLYNSWGVLIYHNAAYKNNWNADGLESGVYFYTINDALLKKKYKGWLHVLK
jgi:hypothetical protein